MKFCDMTPQQRRAFIAVWNAHGWHTGSLMKTLTIKRLDEIAARQEIAERAKQMDRAVQEAFQ